MAIHPTAILSDRARLADDVVIGPYTEITGEVEVGAGTVIDGFCRLEGPLVLGKNNHVHNHCSLGTPPQDLKYKGEPTRLEIGDNNVIREFSTFNRGTVGGGGLTQVGSHGLFMAYSHIAHDCHVGDYAIFANAATLAGHCLIGHHVYLGGFSAVHQFCRIGNYAFIGGFSALTRDAMPYMKTTGARTGCHAFGPNTIGLRRQGFTSERLEAIRRAYRTLFRGDKLKNMTLALGELEKMEPMTEDVRYLIDFITASKRGVIR